MVFFNWATMQMAAKIVYYGPGLCGKTSNLSYIYAKTSPNSRGEMVSLETESDRTLFFDLLPIEVGTIGGFKTRLQLYTVPGQVFYNTTRKLVLKGVDGLVFVADSQRPMRDANIESFKSLTENIEEFGLELSELPIVLQYNKRDLSNVLSIEELNADLNPDGELPFVEAAAVNGDGVITTLKEVTKLTLKKLRSRMTTTADTAQTASKIPAPVARPVKPPQPISASSLARAAEEGVGEKQRNTVEGDAPTAAPVPPVTPVVDEASEAVNVVPPVVEAAPETEFPEQSPSIEPESEPEIIEVEEPSPDEGPTIFEPETETVFVSESGEGEVPIDETGVIEVDFDTATEVEEATPPPVKRVQVSNQVDILAELDGLRKQATMNGRDRDFKQPAPDLDLDSLLSPGSDQTRELRETLDRAVNSDVFKNMRGIQVAIRIQDKGGDTIHTLDPVSLNVEDATALKKLCLRFSLDLENLR